MSDIFLSYRRSDASAIVGRVIDRLETHFGKRHIFRDIDSIEYGQKFGEEIKKALARCKVCLVIIGDDWLDVVDDEGDRRIDNDEDWVRIEVSQALKQKKVHVIPVLVKNALIPNESRLPDNLKDLTSRTAAKVRDDPDFNIDMVRLCRAIERHTSPISSLVKKLFAKPGIVSILAVILSLFFLVAKFNPGLIAVPVASSSQSISEKINSQIKSCLNGARIDCAGLNLKVQEAIMRCKNDIRGQDNVSNSHANNRCSTISGTAYQIQGLVNQIYQNCAGSFPDRCRKAMSDARLHSDEDILRLSEMIADNT